MTASSASSLPADETPAPDYAVLLMAYGGPDSLDDLERYLLDVRGGRPLTPEQLAQARARYAAIGGRSPLLGITRQQAAALSEALQRPVYVGMRHWSPYIADTVMEMAASGVQRAVALCMTPHSSPLSAGAYAAQLQQGLGALPRPFSVVCPGGWYRNRLYVQAVADSISEGLCRDAGWGQAHVVFTAHSLPIRPDDPYDEQVHETAHLLAQRAGLAEGRWSVCYQCQGDGHMPWLGPGLHETVAGLGAQGVRRVLVAPTSFVSDHVEVLYDIDIECRAAAQAYGIELRRTASLNASPAFIAALADVARQAARRWTCAES